MAREKMRAKEQRRKLGMQEDTPVDLDMFKTDAQLAANKYKYRSELMWTVLPACRAESEPACLGLRIRRKGGGGAKWEEHTNKCPLRHALGA